MTQALTTARQQDARDAADDRVLAALDALPARDRELLTLAIWEGLDTGGIAVVVGLKPTATRVALHRARQRLREALAVQGVGDPHVTTTP